MEYSINTFKGSVEVRFIPKSAYESMWDLSFQVLFLIVTITVAGVFMMLIIRLLPFRLLKEIENLLLVAAILISGCYWFLWFTLI